MKKLAAISLSLAALLSSCGSDVVDNGVEDQVDDLGEELREEIDQVTE